QGKSRACYFLEKMFISPLMASSFVELYEGAKELFLIRDFRDVLCSRQSFISRRARVDIQENVEDTIGKVQIFMSQWRQRRTNSHVVRYEDLVLHPIETLQNVFAYLEIDRSRLTVERLLRSAHSVSLSHHVTAPDVLNSIGRWRRDL